MNHSQIITKCHTNDQQCTSYISTCNWIVDMHLNWVHMYLKVLTLLFSCKNLSGTSVMMYLKAYYYISIFDTIWNKRYDGMINFNYTILMSLPNYVDLFYTIILHQRCLHVEHSYEINSCNYYFNRKQHNIDFYEKKSVEYSSFDYPFSGRTTPQREDNS